MRRDLEKSGGSFDYLKRVVDKAQIAIAVPYGRTVRPTSASAGYYQGPAKTTRRGHRRPSVAAPITGIPCVSAEQAEALQGPQGRGDDPAKRLAYRLAAILPAGPKG
jgi:hypothetical protein